MEVCYHIPDILRHHRLNIILYETIKNHPEYFRDGVKIASVYGVFPGAMWNGGRLMTGEMTDDKTMKLCVDDYNSRGIPVRFTFTNPLITKEHLGNPYCNKMLRIANNGMNEVIVNSEILEDYIRTNFPNYKITSSTCKIIRDAEGVAAEFAKNYNLVVLDYNWNNNFEFLESIKEKERCEILVNACCMPNCQRRKEHYEYIGKYQIMYAEFLANPIMRSREIESFKCDYACQNIYNTTGYPTHISPEAIYEKYLPMGYNQFKLEGRTNSDMSVLESYIYYMVKPEFKDRVRLEMSEWLTSKIMFFT